MNALRFCGWFLVGCAFLSPAVRAADVENPEYKSWAAVKAGTTVVRHQVVTTAGNKQEMDLTSKLVELTPEQAVVEDAVAMTLNGQKMNLPGNKRTIPAKSPAPAGPTSKPGDPKASIKEAQDKVDVGGKAYQCKVIETASAHPQGGEVKSKIWTCPDVPGGIVKMETEMTGPVKAVTSLTLVSIDSAK